VLKTQICVTRPQCVKRLLLDVIQHRTDVAGVASTSEVRAPAMLLPTVSHISFNTCVL